MAKCKFILLLLPFLLLQGCMWQTVDAIDVHYAQMLCKEKGGEFIRVNEYWHGGTSVYCKSVEGSYSLENYKREILERGVKHDK